MEFAAEEKKVFDRAREALEAEFDLANRAVGYKVNNMIQRALNAGVPKRQLAPALGFNNTATLVRFIESVTPVEGMDTPEEAEEVAVGALLEITSEATGVLYNEISGAVTVTHDGNTRQIQTFGGTGYGSWYDAEDVPVEIQEIISESFPELIAMTEEDDDGI